jgi:GH15 family glucan-1,4-alpha-glucosidase
MRDESNGGAGRRAAALEHQLLGRVDAALDLYDALCARAGPLGLLPEQIDPSTGMFLGNYPQALSHVGVISSGINLARLAQQRHTSTKWQR